MSARMASSGSLSRQESGLSITGDRQFILGIDLGTTSVKVCLIDTLTHKCLKQLNKSTQANVPSELGSEGNKQYVPKIISALHNCVSRLPREALRRVEKIGVSGQMHGCVLWKAGQAWSRKSDSHSWEMGQVSHLYTWQDTRCTPEFLATLPPPDSHLSVHSGYGVATLLWFLRHKPEKLSMYDRAGTIQDLVVAMLCNLDKPVMSVQNAASWGYFNTETRQWNLEILRQAGLPLHLLPDVVESGRRAGHLPAAWENISSGTPVGAALGDLQCSVQPLLAGPETAVLNVSTSAQLAVLLADGFAPPRSAEAGQCIMYVPYLNGAYLAVAAALTGGNALATFVQTLQRWTQQLGFSIPQSAVWSKILALAESDPAGSGSGSGDDPELVVVPTVYGERHAPQQRASASGLDVGNTDLGQLTRAICRGIAANLESMMSHGWLQERGVSRIVGTGSALSRNPALLRAFQDAYRLPVTLGEDMNAAYGAACTVSKMD